MNRVQELMGTGCGDIIEELADMDDTALARTQGGLKTVGELVEAEVAIRARSKGEQYCDIPEHM